MRKRKRDWPQRVYKFWVRPTAETGLPQAFWDHARAIQSLWRALVRLRKATKTEAELLPETERKERWKRFDREARTLVEKANLGWEDGPYTLDRFYSACKLHGDLHERRLDRIVLLHRFTGGGAALGQIFSTRASRIHIGAIPEFAWEDESRQTKQRRFTRGQWGLPGGSKFSFDILYHRQIPANAIIKRVQWCGVHHNVKGWQWALTVQVEEPPETYSYEHPTVRVAGLDLGWRLMAEGSYLRVGLVSDNESRTIELRLPLLQANSKDRRHQEHFRTHSVVFIPHATFRDILHIDHLIGEAVEDCKGQLKQLLPTLPAGFVQMRQKGLAELLAKMPELSDNPAQQAAIRSALEGWRDRNTELRRYKIIAGDKAIARRRAAYRVMANWLTKTYSTIIWEGDLSLKKMREQHDNPALENAKKQSNWAALGELRDYLRHAAAKNHCTLIDAPSAYSTSTCWECKGEIQTNGNRILVCVNGHRRDQDWNSALNLRDFSQTSEGVAHNGILRQKEEVDVTEILDIPWHLRAVATNCTGENLL